jgi:DnaJ domain
MTASQDGNKDYYVILGIRRTATLEQVEAAYRNMARKWHPDVCADAGRTADEFKAVSEAYDVLADPQKRHHYDRQHTGRSPSAQLQRKQRAGCVVDPTQVIPDDCWPVPSFSQALDALLCSTRFCFQENVTDIDTTPLSNDLEVEVDLFATAGNIFPATDEESGILFERGPQRRTCRATSAVTGYLELGDP